MELLEGIQSLNDDEKKLLKDYIDKSIEFEINKLRQEIKNKNYSKDDFNNAFSHVLGRR